MTPRPTGRPAATPERRAQERLEKARSQHRARQTRERAARSRRDTRRARVRDMPPHARRRRRLLRWSWLPAGLLLALALNLVLLGPGYQEARALYDAGEDWESTDAFDRQERWAVVERWKASFNAGTARYRAQRYRSAVDHLDDALRTVPDEHRCDVQTNRALALLALEEEARDRAEEKLELAQALAQALDAQAAGEPFDAEVLEPPYEGADPPEVADELWMASFYLRDAADSAALAAEALADPACTPPPSQGGGGGEDDEDAPQDPTDPQDQGGGGGGGGDDSPQQQAEQRLLDLLELAGDVERLAQAAEDGTLEGLPEPGAGDQETPDPAQAEAERQQQLAERNGRTGGGPGQEAPGGGQGTGTAPGGGTGPGSGGGGGGRNW